MREIKFRAYNVLAGTTTALSRISLPIKTDDGDGHYLMQYTGLKDKNGTEIYEGDIVNSWAGLYGHDNVYLREVVYGDNCGLEFKPLTGFTLCKKNEHLFEVIGNIHQNPELL